jgi:hypothetical protein
MSDKSREQIWNEWRDLVNMQLPRSTIFWRQMKANP